MLVLCTHNCPTPASVLLMEMNQAEALSPHAAISLGAQEEQGSGVGWVHFLAPPIRVRPSPAPQVVQVGTVILQVLCCGCTKPLPLWLP